MGLGQRASNPCASGANRSHFSRLPIMNSAPVKIRTFNLTGHNGEIRVGVHLGAVTYAQHRCGLFAGRVLPERR